MFGKHLSTAIALGIMTNTFYDRLAPYYHLILADWEQSIEKQGEALDKIIQTHWGVDTASVHDVACGIGTQSIALAKRGYQVAGTDLSPKSIDRAKQEAEKRGLDISYSVCDMRDVSAGNHSDTDIIICCDNALPHLLSDQDIKEALVAFYQCLKPGGGCLITVRDYEKEDKVSNQIKPYKVQVENGQRYILFQIWEFTGDIYDLALYLIIDEGGQSAETKIFRTKYYAIPVDRLIRLMLEVGFKDVKGLNSEFYQPVIIGTK